METRPDTSSLGNRMLLGKRADALSVLIERQIAPIFALEEILIPVRSCSLMLALADAGQASASDLAKSLGQSHQLVLQKVPALVDLDLIERHPDPRDNRRRIFSLTTRGAEQVERLLACESAIEGIYQELYGEIGVDLFGALGRALEALETRDLVSRYQSRTADDVAYSGSSSPQSN